MSCRRIARSGRLAGLGLAMLASTARAQPVPATLDAPTQAAEGSAPRLNEVVVTASRRAGELQKTPTSISSVSSATLDASFVNDLSGLNGVVPGLEVTHASGFESLVNIRGVGYATPENSPTNVPGVAEFVDGVYIANTISLD